MSDDPGNSTQMDNSFDSPGVGADTSKPAASKKELRRELQAKLDAAMRALAATRAEKSDRGCNGTVASCTSCFAVLVGLGLAACGTSLSVLGVALAIGGVIG